MTVEIEAGLARPATLADAPAITEIYNQGIEGHKATSEIRLRRVDEIEKWFDGVHPIVVIERRGRVIAFASTSLYSYHECYDGIAEFSVYVDREFRGLGAGRQVMNALIAAAEQAGFWKLISRVFLQNQASRHLLGSLGFEEVGIHKKHGKVDGVWQDMVIVERLIPANLQ